MASPPPTHPACGSWVIDGAIARGASLDIAIEVAPQFGLKPVDAKRIVAEVGAATARWQTAASRFGIAASEIERLRSAFEHEESRAAAR
jgi:serine/threonine-protein kinase HipA